MKTFSGMLPQPAIDYIEKPENERMMLIETLNSVEGDLLAAKNNQEMVRVEAALGTISETLEQIKEESTCQV